MRSIFIALLFPIVIPAFSQELDARQKSFLRAEAESVQEKNGANFWKPVEDQIGSKRMVMLGEFTHGSREITLNRNDLISYLHENIGFDLILFESGLGELAAIESDKKNMSPEQMTSGFFGGWRTKEFAELMAYVKEKDMAIGGFDVQRTGDGFLQLIKQVGSAEGIDVFSWERSEKQFSEIKNDLSDFEVGYETVKPKTELLIRDYQEALAKAGTLGASPQNKYLLRTFENRIAYLEYMLEFKRTDGWHKRWTARDSLMAENVKWLREEMFPGKKVIVVAHNYHVAKYNRIEKVMGEFLEPRFGRSTYVIGAFAAQGEYANNAGEIEELSPSDPVDLDIKDLILALKGEVNFLDLECANSRGGEWLDESIVVHDSFIDLNNSKKLNLAKQFDGILLLKKSSPPQKL